MKGSLAEVFCSDELPVSAESVQREETTTRIHRCHETSCQYSHHTRSNVRIPLKLLSDLGLPRTQAYVSIYGEVMAQCTQDLGLYAGLLKPTMHGITVTFSHAIAFSGVSGHVLVTIVLQSTAQLRCARIRDFSWTEPSSIHQPDSLPTPHLLYRSILISLGSAARRVSISPSPASCNSLTGPLAPL